MSKARTYSTDVAKTHVDQTITLFGWVDTIRDHGHLLFIHLRDIKGIIQVVFDPEEYQDTYKTAQDLKPEYVIQIDGIVRERSDDTKNPNLPTGEIEIKASKLTILNASQTPPFLITQKDTNDDTPFNVDEDIRLTYRYLDLRREEMKHNITSRSNLIKIIRDHMHDEGFFDIETPILTKSTPEGARDYLVPSRVQAETCYALPQSPQLFKQLLMISGYEKYYQIAKCFRDEDLRPNRQPEFTQLDIEASFVDETYIFSFIENLMEKLFAYVKKPIQTPIQHISYHDAMETYGSDKPDLRYDLKMVSMTEALKDVEYKIFKGIIQSGGTIKGMNIKGQADVLTKNLLQNEFAMKLIPEMGGKGMTWMKVENGELQSNIVQFFTQEQQDTIKKELNAEDGDVLVFIADKNHQLVLEVLGKFRAFIAKRQGFIDESKQALCWITDFPLFEWKNNRLNSLHHPFTQPNQDITSISDPKELLQVKARAYDLVLNGEEIGGGSIRIHDPKTQHHIFKMLSISEEEIQEKFGFFIKALNYGTPPHGGIALGIDRLISLLLDQESIREVIAFPKNRAAYCPLTGAPDTVTQAQLEDLNMRFT